MARCPARVVGAVLRALRELARRRKNRSEHGTRKLPRRLATSPGAAQDCSKIFAVVPHLGVAQHTTDFKRYD